MNCFDKHIFIAFVLILQGCRAPLVVKFADTQKEKEMKKLQQVNANLLGLTNLSGLGSLGPQYLSVSISLNLTTTLF